MTSSGANISGLGYRQKKLLAALQDFGRPMPTGYLVRVLFEEPDPIANKTVNVALTGLQRRELARRVRHGLWESVA